MAQQVPTATPGMHHVDVYDKIERRAVPVPEPAELVSDNRSPHRPWVSYVSRSMPGEGPTGAAG